MEDVLEYFGVISGLLYLLLEIRQHKAMWVVGFLTSLAYVFVFFMAKVYADMGLSVYYVGISVYGFIKWNRKGSYLPEETTNGKEVIVYRHITARLLMGVTGATVGIFGVIWYVLSRYTDSPIPVGDAFTTAVGIVATWMLAKCIIEHWAYWVVANLVSVYLYYLRGLYPTMFLYLCYAILAVVGFCIWKRKGVKANDNRV